jgi:hypothetical protein
MNSTITRRRRLTWIVAILAAVILPGICSADGLIVIEDPPHVLAGHFSFAPLQVSFHHVTVSVTDLVAVTTVDEEFYNPNRERLEGTYIHGYRGKDDGRGALARRQGAGLLRGHRAEDEGPGPA